MHTCAYSGEKDDRGVPEGQKSKKKTCQKFLVWEGIIDKFLIALLSFIFFSLTSSFFPLIFPLLLSAAKPSDLGTLGVVLVIVVVGGGGGGGDGGGGGGPLLELTMCSFSEVYSKVARFFNIISKPK